MSIGVVDLAKARLSDRSEKAFRSTSDVRPQAVKLIRDAMERFRFRSMDLAQIQNFALGAGSDREQGPEYQRFHEEAPAYEVAPGSIPACN